MNFMYVLTTDEQWIEQVGGQRASNGSSWVAVPVDAERISEATVMGKPHIRCSFDSTPADWRNTPAHDRKSGGFTTVFPVALTEAHFPEHVSA